MGAWWQSAVVYQVYLRSFADGDGDGTGDIAGLRSRLDYLAWLGVDALWINPWYPSPMVDAGYDVADYRDIHPMYGDLAQAQALIEEAHNAGLRVLLDIVPNHTSSMHPWFQAALSGEQWARERYLFRPGRGPAGAEPPNDWQSTFGGRAWTEVPGEPGQWYLHMFAPEQPDLDWTNPAVRTEFEDILRFWFDRGADGFRIDVAHGLAKAPGLPDVGAVSDSSPLAPHPAWDQDEVHEIYRGWRKVADSYDPPRAFVAEAWVADGARLAQYIRSNELHTAFWFDFLRAPWNAAVMREVIDNGVQTAGDVGARSTWVLSNHDVVREVTRYARSQQQGLADMDRERLRWRDEPADLEVGTRRARAAALLLLALPGSAYLYQGEELGLPEVEDISSEARQDPRFWQSGYVDPGRDGCRVPLPWSGSQSPYGFSPADASDDPWMPQPAMWARLSVEAQRADRDSVLTLYRSALGQRRDHWADAGPLQWLDAPRGVLAFRRGEVECWVNMSPDTIDLPDAEVLLTSRPAAAGRLRPDSAGWLRRPTGQ